MQCRSVADAADLPGRDGGLPGRRSRAHQCDRVGRDRSHGGPLLRRGALVRRRPTATRSWALAVDGALPVAPRTDAGRRRRRPGGARPAPRRSASGRHRPVPGGPTGGRRAQAGRRRAAHARIPPGARRPRARRRRRRLGPAVGADDLELAADWIDQFSVESGALAARPARVVYGPAGQPWFWEVDGDPVSFAGHAPLVTTPAGHRGAHRPGVHARRAPPPRVRGRGHPPWSQRTRTRSPASSCSTPTRPTRRATASTSGSASPWRPRWSTSTCSVA